MDAEPTLPRASAGSTPAESARAASHPLRAEVDGQGVIRMADAELADLLGSATADLVGRSIDDFAVGARRRSIVRAASDAATGIDEIGPVDLWLAGDGGAAVACRFWISRIAGADDRFRVEGHDLADLDPDHRLRALETILLERVALGDTLTGVLGGVAQLIEWMLEGVQASIGAIDEDGVIRHRASGSMPADVTAVFDAMDPDERLAEVGRSAHGLVVVDEPGATDARLARVLDELHAGALWLMRVEQQDSSAIAGIAAVLAPPGVVPDGAVYNVIRSACDIASTAISRAWSERQMVHQSLHDPLTGLPNRTLLFDRIGQAVNRSRRRGEPRTAVMMIDLDHFRVANDSMGHAVGDSVLVWAAQALTDVIRDDETVGRFGGDEFLVVSPVRDEQDAAARADEIRRALEMPVGLGSVTIRTSASIGCVVAGPLADVRALVRDADAALHRAKDEGRNRVAMFEPSLRESALARVELETALRAAIADSELEVHYQPIVDLETFAVAGVEALVRWRRSSREIIGPADFVPLAEDVGLIDELGIDVLNRAAETAHALRRSHWPDLVMSVNVSARQLTDALVDAVDGVLRSSGLAPAGLCLEITEGVLTRAGADAVVRALAQLGVGVAIDDFGTGYASLEYLRRFPVATVLKIDASFVGELEGPDPAGQAIVAAASVLGHSLGMDVVAEGVETVGQLQLLRELGYDRGQGFLIGRPVAADDLPGALGRVVSPPTSG